MTDIEIAQQNTMQDIYKIARKAGISEEYLETYGRYKAKVDLKAVENKPRKGKLILVTAINPTKAGEGKSTVTVGLTDALAQCGKRVVAALREPSMGPVFGIKGGATGGGYAQVMPMEDINLHFTGDMHAITSVNNLIAAMIDNHIYQGNELEFETVTWKRCLDVNDRALRKVTIEESGRPESFNITVASEVMAILCLSKDLQDFEERINRCIVGYNKNKKPIYARQLNCGGAAAILMKDAIKPNLVQTLEHTPVLIHGGPFANIAHGCNSIIATDMALRLGDYVVTEAGFGADLGAEKFLDIKCQYGDFAPNAIVLVATIRALKMHGEGSLEKGIVNLEKHIENIKKYNVPLVVAINRFTDDTNEEIEYLHYWCEYHGVLCAECNVWEKGGAGGIELANAVINLCNMPSSYTPLYNWNGSIKDKIETIAKEIYGADGVDYIGTAEEDIRGLYGKGLDTNLPICMSKTPNSLSDQPRLIGRPEGFRVSVREVRYSNGAGMIIPICGSIMTMPGLPKEPAACKMSIDNNGTIKGLF